MVTNGGRRVGDGVTMSDRIMVWQRPLGIDFAPDCRLVATQERWSTRLARPAPAAISRPEMSLTQGPSSYPRDMVGYGRNPPNAAWPDGARVAVQFVINYEEGGENNILHGDAASEAFLSEIVGALPFLGQRHMNMESIYEYGSRAGLWRLHRMFTERKLPVTVYAVGMAMERHPEAVASWVEADWEIATHGWRWINYQDIPEATEREHLKLAIAAQVKA